MNYSKNQIGNELRNELIKGCNLERISNWAYDLLYIKMRDRPSMEIRNILNDLSGMDSGPEFEYSEEELKLLAEMLINEEKDPIKQINDMKSKNLH